MLGYRLNNSEVTERMMGGKTRSWKRERGRRRKPRELYQRKEAATLWPSSINVPLQVWKTEIQEVMELHHLNFCQESKWST